MPFVEASALQFNVSFPSDFYISHLYLYNYSSSFDCKYR